MNTVQKLKSEIPDLPVRPRKQALPEGSQARVTPAFL